MTNNPTWFNAPVVLSPSFHVELRGPEPVTARSLALGLLAILVEAAMVASAFACLVLLATQGP